MKLDQGATRRGVLPRILDDSPSSLRRLVSLFYMVVLPILGLVVALNSGRDWPLPVLAIAAICGLSLVLLAINRQPRARDWIYPVGIAPVLCFGLAAWVLGDSGLVFAVLATAPLSWAAVLFGVPVVIATLSASAAVCFALTWRATDPLNATVALGIFLIVEGLVAGAALGRLNSLARSTNDRATACGFSQGELEGMNIRDLRASKEQLALAISGSGIGLWDWWVQTGALVVNEQWAAMLGYTLPELEPLDIGVWTRLAHPEDLELSGQLLEEHLLGHSPEFVCEARMRHKDGSWIWVLNRGKVAEWGADGKPQRMIGTQQEITRRKEIEMQMSSILREVLTQDALKERLFTILAHDLRGPIGNLNNLLGLAVAGDFGETELREVLVNLKSSAESAYSLLDNILQWVRSSMQEITVLKERITVDELVATVCTWLEPSAKSKSIELTNETAPQLSVVADRRMCETILRNLVSNALKFSPPGRAVHIRTGYRRDTQEIRIMVQDHGAGIPAEVLERINRREPGVSSRGTGGEMGSGLGLMFCKDLAARMDTRLEIETQAGSGSTVSLVFTDVIDGELDTEPALEIGDLPD